MRWRTARHNKKNQRCPRPIKFGFTGYKIAVKKVKMGIYKKMKARMQPKGQILVSVNLGEM